MRPRTSECKPWSEKSRMLRPPRGGRVPWRPVPERQKRRATIRQLAEHTGLSPAAVSYALRGMHVSAETEERVRAAAEELGYEADPIARALAGGETAVVGLLVDHRVDGLVVVPIGPGSGGWAAIAEQIPTVTIGDALAGVAAAGEVVFD